MRRVTVLLIAFSLAAGVLVVTAAPALAETISVKPVSGPPGTVAEITGSGFFDPCQIRFGGATGSVVGNCDADGAGNVLTSFVVPNVKAGQYVVWACSFCGGGEFETIVTTTFTVTAPPTTTTSTSTTSTSTPSSSTTSTVPGSSSTSTSTTVPGDTSSTTLPVLLDLPPLVTGLAVPPIAGGFAPIGLRNGLVELPDVWLLRCGAPPGSNRVDFDDQELDRSPTFGVSGEPGGMFFSGRGFPRVGAPAEGTATAPHALPLQILSAPNVLFFDPVPKFVANEKFNYFGLHVGLGETIDEPIVVELAARKFPGQWMDVDRVELGPGISPATTCLMVTAPEGETLREVHLRIYRPGFGGESSPTTLINVDSLFWSSTLTYPIEPAPEPVEVEILFPTPTTRLSAGRNTAMFGRLTWPAGLPITSVAVASPNWNATAALVREAQVGRGRTDGLTNSRLFWIDDIEVPTGPFQVSVTAIGPKLRGSDSVELEGIGAPSPPRTEYREMIEGQVDVIPWAMEITQAVRGPLTVQEPGTVVTDLFKHAAGKRTVVRGYATHQISASLGFRADQIFANAVLHGTRDGVTLPFSPLRPENSDVRIFAASPGAGAERVSRPFAQNTFNFVLPYGWTTGDDIELRLEVNPPGSPSYIAELPDRGGWQNTISQRVGFTDVGRVGVSVLNVDFHWRCTESMTDTEDTGHPCFGRAVGDEVSTSRSNDEIRSATQGWWKSIPAPGDFPAYLTFSSIELPHKDDDPRVSVDRAISGRAATVSWENWRNAYWDLYCGDGDIFNPTKIRPPTVRDFVWMTQPPYAPLRGGGCAWVNNRSAFRANTFWATPAQEAGHTTGLRHTGNAHGELSGGKAVIRFGGDHGQIDLPDEPTWGFDTTTMSVLNPGTGGHVHDYMSYGGGLVWTSVGTWDHVYRALANNETFGEGRGTVISGSGGAEASAGAPGDGDAYIIEGSVDTDGDVTVDAPYRGDAGVLFFPEGDDVTVTIDTPGGTLSMSVGLDEGTTHLGSGLRRFAVAFPADSDPDSLTVEVEGAEPVSIEVIGSGAGISIDEVGPSRISWSPGDASGPFIVEATDDGGESWWMLGETDLSALDLAPGLNPLVGAGWTIRVQGADGPRVLLDEEPIDFGIPVPIASIGAPLDGARLPVGTVHAYAAVGAIGEDGSTYSWAVDGEEFNDGAVTDLPVFPGEQVVTLTVENATGSAEHSISVFGVFDTDGDGIDDEWEELHGLDPNVPDFVEEDLDEDGLSLGAEFQNQTDPTDSDTDDDGYSDGLELLGAGDPLDPLIIAGPVHGFDDSTFGVDPDVPFAPPGGVPPWLWVVLGVALVAPAGYWLLRRPGGRRPG